MKKIGKLKTYTSKEIEKSYVGIDFCCLDRDLFKAEECYEPLAKTGVKYARCQTGWAKTEKQKGVYDWKWLDDVVDNLYNRGIEPWLCVSFGNPVYMGELPNPTGVGCVPIHFGEETVEAWKKFARAVAERYKDKVNYFEIWNESQLDHFWYPEKPNGAELAKLVNITAKEISDVHPEAKFVVNTCAPTYFQYFEDLFSNVKKEYLDIFAYHTYSTIPEYRIGEALAEVRRLLKKHGLEHVELWQGEGGYPSWAYEGHWLVKEGCDDERPQAVYQLRRYFIDVSLGAKMSSFFQMADMWEKPYEKATDVIKKPAGHGIVNGLTYTPKKSYETITYLSTLLSGDIKPSDDFIIAYVWSENPADSMACQKMSFDKNGIPVYAYYYPSDLKKPLEDPNMTTINILKKLDNPILIDTFTGEVFELEVPEFNHGYAYNVPLKEYPLVITDKKAYEIIEE